MLNLAHNKIRNLSPMLFHPESSNDCANQKLLQEGPWTYQVAQNLDFLINALPTILYIPPLE